MKILLVATNTKRKSLVFISDELTAYSLEEALQLAREGKIEETHTVQRGQNIYIRTNPKVPKSEEFDTISTTVGNLLLYAQEAHVTEVIPALKFFIELYRANMEKHEQIIKPVGQPEVLVSSVKAKLEKNRDIIFAAAKKFDLDPYLIGAILVDEISRMIPFEAIVDKIGVLIAGKNMSVGLGQVKIDTANNIIKLRLYNPNPSDSKLPFKKMDNAARAHLYTYLIVPKHNIFFAAAVIRDILDSWIPIAGKKLTNAVIGTLYSKGGIPHPDPDSNGRGEQIAGEFYKLAKKILK